MKTMSDRRYHASSLQSTLVRIKEKNYIQTQYLDAYNYA